MKLPVVVTKGHQGKILEIDSKEETITLLGLRGETLGTVTWGVVIEFIRSLAGQPRPDEARKQPRVSLTAKVRYLMPNGAQVEGRASGVGGGGMFIENTNPMAVGTEFMVTFALPDQPNEWLQAKGKVAWVCPRPDQYTFYPGMGVRFTTIAQDARARVIEFVSSLKRTDQKE